MLGNMNAIENGLLNSEVWNEEDDEDSVDGQDRAEEQQEGEEEEKNEVRSALFVVQYFYQQSSSQLYIEKGL